MSTSNMTVSSMAEELSQQTLMVNKHVPVVDGISKDEPPANLSDKEIISGDVLQPSVNETEEYDQNVFEQNRNTILQENIHHLSDHSYIHTDKSPTFDSISTQDLNSVGTPIVSDKEINKNLDLHNLSFVSDKCASDSSGNHLKSLILSEGNDINLNNGSLTFNAVEGNCSENIYANEAVIGSNPLIISENPVSSSNSSSHAATALPSSSVSASSNFTLSNLKLLTTKKTSAPLGSVENPIQITHKGDSFETTQVLTQAQLQQISYVLQNQRANKIQNGGRSVLFDPTTNTRIVCRIVHPSELQGTNSKVETASKPNAVRRASSSSRGKGRHRRTDDEDKGNPYLTKEEREERKKQRPRTRSGRISKPPSYMVKDYKRIHHLDFDEDAYDSDGGYSDYHVSDEESGKSGSKEEGLPPGVTTSKQRNYACQKCPKAYIGKGGLSRHYRLNPSHGSMQEGEDVSTQDENSSSSLASSVLSSSGGQNNTQNGSNSFPQVPVRFETEGTLEKSPQLPSTSQANSILSARRRTRLKEILKGYPEDELMDVVLPDLAQKVSLWDFFLKKCDEKSGGLRIYEMLKEFEKFLVEMQKISHVHLSPASYEDHGKTIINISSKQIAEALSLERGAYFVNDPSATISNAAFSERLSTNQSGEIIQPHAKRKRIDQNMDDISSGLPDQILSEVHESGNLDLPLPEVTFPVNSVFQKQENHIFSSTLTAVDSQNDLAPKNLFDLSSSTTVTPSSLSSGCLSAVNTPKSQKMNMLFTANGAQQLHNLQIRKVQLLGTESQQQVLVKNGTKMSINGFTLPPDFNLSEISSNKTMCMNNRQAEVDCSNLTAKSTFQTLNLGGNIDILNRGLQESAGMCSSQSNDPSLSDISHVNNTHISHASQITNTQKVQDEVSKNINCLPLVDVQNSAAIVNDNEIQACLPPDITSSSNVLEESREFEIASSDIAPESTKTSDSSQILRHFVLPDGQLIGVWSPVDNSEKSVNDQLVQNCLSGNLIIVQNPDGTIQVPSNQNLTLETLQTFVSVDPGQTTSTYTTVHM